MKILDWNPKNDKSLKEKEIAIHHEYHANLASKELTKKDLFESAHRMLRINALLRSLELANTKIKGNILEIGAGDGWCSAYILRQFSNQIENIHIMETNDSAINFLIPKSLNVAEVNTNNVSLVKGSFNDIQLKNNYDFVIAMGAIHHSADLRLTFQNIYNSLKPGGWFLAQEPFMINQTKNKFYFDREKNEINFKGIIKVKNNERSDLFYRECEYMTAAYHSGFDFNSEYIVNEYTKKGLFGKAVPKLKSDGPNNMLIYAQKPIENYDWVPVTSW